MDGAVRPVLVAPDKFKGSLTAVEVANALVAGLRVGASDVAPRIAPVADGGDGTVTAALAQGFRALPARVTGPLGAPVDTEIAVHGDTAVVELASASGLALAPELAPLTATSFGTGELIGAALDAGAREIVLGVGGSACTDGGAGMLAALGAVLTDASGDSLPHGGGPLRDLDAVDLSTLDERLDRVEIVLASDVDNVLLGPTGAAHVYGPQKGADAAQVELLDAALSRWARAVVAAGGRDAAEEPGAGAAGGVGFAALSALGARSRAGTDLLLDLVGFDDRLADCGLVITGEGLLDEQTLHGKAPSGVATRAARAGVPVIAVAGACDLPPSRLREAGFTSVYALSDREPDTATSIRDASRLLTDIGEDIAREWLH